MLECYVELKSHARLVEAVENFVPRSSGHKKLVDVLRHLRKFDSVCKRLQCEATTLSEVRLLFDSVVADYPIMGDYLKPTSKIVHSAAFEGGLVKLAYGGDLSATETAALKRLERPRAEERPQATGGKRKKRDENYAAQIIEQGGAKRRKSEWVVYAALASLIGFEGIPGLCVAICTLESPLYEFLAHKGIALDELCETLSKEMKVSKVLVQSRMSSLKKANPIMGLRGSHLGITEM
ncbi:hypothetical protein PR002_g15522 [Phytophthora rubi]|uniref:Uncharacterized protein n=1 Tax=Phytophthora rubi TaxID=129364 RepID=A0A6A3KWA3_9STRA|nr:hypothetical protein PR002_g15522 [Phytophthora rubi]